MTDLVSPAEALNYLREEFPAAHMVSMRGKNGVLMGYGFRVGVSLRTEMLDENGRIHMFGIRLFRDGLTYARDKAAAKRALKALRAPSSEEVLVKVTYEDTTPYEVPVFTKGA